MKPKLTTSQAMIAHSAGWLYILIIVMGIGSELAFRGPLVDLTNAQATATAILSHASTFRLSIAADMIMALADIGLAVLLFTLFRSVSPMLALAAMVFRLVQSVIIGANLMNLQAALLLLTGGQDIAALAPGQAEAISVFFLNMHGHGYDLGLVFFGINSLMTGILIWRAGFIGRVFGLAIAAAGLVYLVGSTFRFFAPDLLDAFAPAYGLTVIAEGAFCVWLLIAGWSNRRAAIRSTHSK